jgi:esterase/lipase superfamily enzyme
LGSCEVSIPSEHERGEFESPVIYKLEFAQDPSKHIVLREVTQYGEDQFHRELKQSLAAHGNSLLVFVHGYNVDFDNAARRTAQLACDLEFSGVPLFFSWPSQGNWYEYRKDEKQVALAVPYLRRFLTEVVSRSQATSMHLIAHSMGNRALTAALQEIALTAQSQSVHFNQVVLAAPDIDADIFRDQIAPSITNQAERVTLYASSNDWALFASRTFNSGDPRAGDTNRKLVVLPGIETIDVSEVDTSLLGHSYYGDNPTVLTDLKELLNSARPADERPFLEPVVEHTLRYWVFHHPAVAERALSGTMIR